MIAAEDLMIGNYVMLNTDYTLPDWHQITAKDICDIAKNNLPKGVSIEPIPLTPDVLEKVGFNQLPHFTVDNGWRIDVGRNRVVHISCVGTLNEMVFLSEEEPPTVKDLIVLRNFDYDGKTFLHQLQNICKVFGKDLKFKTT